MTPVHHEVIPREWSEISSHALRCACRAFLLGHALRHGFSLSLKLLVLYKSKKGFKEALISSFLQQENLDFAMFSGTLIFIWKGVSESMHKLRGVSDRWNGFIAGALSGLALLIEDKKRRVVFGQQILLRGLQMLCDEHQMKVPRLVREHFNAWLFVLASAQIMYGYAMSPESLAKGFYTFIRSTGPVSEQALQLTRQTARGGSLNLDQVKQAMGPAHKWASNAKALQETVGSIAITECGVLHPDTDFCSLNALRSFVKVMLKILPVYFSLNIVPTVVLKFKAFLSKPWHVFKRSFQNAMQSSVFLSVFCSSFMALVCVHRKLYSIKWVNTQHRALYFLIGILSSLSIYIEHAKRRTELALYTLPKGLESLYFILNNRKLMFRIPYFEVGMFCMGMGLMVAYLQNSPERMQSLLGKFLKHVDALVEDDHGLEMRKENLEKNDRKQVL